RETTYRMMRNISYPDIIVIIPPIFIPRIIHEGIVQLTAICSHIKRVLYKAVFTERIVHTVRKYLTSPCVVLKSVLLYQSAVTALHEDTRRIPNKGIMFDIAIRDIFQ